MKLDLKKQIDFASNAGFDGFDASISADDMHKLWDMLQNPYKDPIGAVVREYTSNSFDSHAEAQFIKTHSLQEIRDEYKIYQNFSDEDLTQLQQAMGSFENPAVVVNIAKDETGWFWSTEDFGIGLSEERIKDVFVSYLKSTKESSNSVIGCFGMGSKSGLSYADMVFIRTRYLGTEYNYMLRKGEKGPRLDIIEEPTATTERNGTEIKIYMTDSYHTYDFKKACRQQLPYFDNVYFTDGVDIKDSLIIRGTHWLVAQNPPIVGAHICLGKVAYPIDWKVLGIDDINIPVALTFEVGELDVIQTREDVKYTERTKAAIKEKIELLREELSTRWEAIPKECSSLVEYYDKKNENAYIEFHSPFYVKIPVTHFLKLVGTNGYYYKPFRDAGITEENLPARFSNLFFEYVISGEFKYRFQSQNFDPGHVLNTRTAIYRISGEHSSRVSKYIQCRDNVTNFLLLRKKNYVKLPIYKLNLKLHNSPKSAWRTIISTYQKELQKTVIALTKSYDKAVPTKEYLDSIKTERSAIDRTVMNIKILRSNFSTYNWYEYTNDKLSVEKLNTWDQPVCLVGNENERSRLTLISLAYKLCRIAPTQLEVAPTNVFKLKNMKNFLTVDEFKSGNNEVFKQTMSILKLYARYKETFKALEHFSYKSNQLLTKVMPKEAAMFTKWGTLFSNAVDFVALDKRFNYFLSKDCMKIAEQNNLFDYQLEKELERFLMIIKQLHNFNWMSHSEDDDKLAVMISEMIYLNNKFNPTTIKVRLPVHTIINLNAKFHKPVVKKTIVKKQDVKKEIENLLIS